MPSEISFFPPNPGKILVTGKDRISVLHNILTQDIQKLKVGQKTLAALLSSQGKILAWMEVFLFEESILLLTEPGFEEKTILFLDRYIISEEVELKNVSQENFPVKTNPLALDTWEMLRIRQGIPRYGIDMDENTILSETGLEKIAASETKGCYPGQEVVARIETYKGLNRKLKRLILNASEKPSVSSKIFTEDRQTEIGKLTSSVFLPEEKSWAALGYLNKGYFDGSRKIKISWDGICSEGEALA